MTDCPGVGGRKYDVVRWGPIWSGGVISHTARLLLRTGTSPFSYHMRIRRVRDRVRVRVRVSLNISCTFYYVPRPA